MSMTDSSISRLISVTLAGVYRIVHQSVETIDNIIVI